MPLSDEQLQPLANHSNIVALHVPTPETRPESIVFPHGRSYGDGDILHFWIEQADSYRRVTYESSQDRPGMAWFAAPNPVEQDTEAEDVIRDSLRENFEAMLGDDDGFRSAAELGEGGSS